jgi:hypothetical protein
LPHLRRSGIKIAKEDTVTIREKIYELYFACKVGDQDKIWGPKIFFSGETSRCRCYGRTAALRLIVQPCDEDDDDNYYYFLSFS